MVSQSAREFLSKLLPQFSFQETTVVPDYSPGNENVWGYGADQPTAGRLVDRSLDWLREHRDQPFFMWVFNFDVHNWRELDDAYARQAGKQFGLFDEADPVWRYRVAAREVDAQLGRFLDGLRDLGVADDTVLLFVSDHGEGLGRDGFWVHSVFLWDSLVHVPLMLRAPGVPPSRVGDVVSLVDVAPTLARYMVVDAETGGYQGEDLLGYVVPNRPARQRPLLFMGTLKEVPVRLGIIDPSAPWKLVLPLEGAVPELYDLRAADPDSLDVSGERRPEMLRLLNELVRAPLFPRLNEAGNGPLDQAATEGRTAIEKEGLDRKPEETPAP
jgi:arylsulfatase A-like enzyme